MLSASRNSSIILTIAIKLLWGSCPFRSIQKRDPAPGSHNITWCILASREKRSKPISAQPATWFFLLDVSGSMDTPEKLPLLKKAFKLLVEQLDNRDRVAIVVYAGAAGLVLPSTPATEARVILHTIEKLNAGGSTAGGEGILLAYQVAKDHFIPSGNNRVILATDGDFNVGPSSEGELVRMIESKRDEGIFLSVLGFGSGNYKDNKMEQLADKGNGNYAYIDNILEAKKVPCARNGRHPIYHCQRREDTGGSLILLM